MIPGSASCPGEGKLSQLPLKAGPLAVGRERGWPLIPQTRQGHGGGAPRGVDGAGLTASASGTPVSPQTARLACWGTRDGPSTLALLLL